MADRKLDVDGEKWLFRVGKSAVKIRDPQGKGYAVNFSELTGRDWHTLERGLHKRTSDGMITPSHIRRYIDKNIRKVERIFVRSEYQISHDSPGATGQRTKESDCINEFGNRRWESMLREMDDSGSALLFRDFWWTN